MVLHSIWNSEIKAKLEILLSSKQEGIAVFDFDNTLIFGDQGINLMNFLIQNFLIKINENWFWNDDYWNYVDPQKKENLINFIKNIKYTETDSLKLLDWNIFEELEKKNLEIAYRWTKIFYAGFTIKELNNYSLMSFKKALEEDDELLLPGSRRIKKKIRINPALKNLIEILLHQNWKVFIITASPEIAIQAVSNYWEIPETHVFGMKLKIEKEYLLPEIIEPFPYDHGKYKIFKDFVSGEIDLAVGDSYPDIEILRNSKLPIFVDRNNKVLNQFASSQNFFIQNFFSLY